MSNKWFNCTNSTNLNRCCSFYQKHPCCGLLFMLSNLKGLSFCSTPNFNMGSCISKDDSKEHVKYVKVEKEIVTDVEEDDNDNYKDKPSTIRHLFSSKNTFIPDYDDIDPMVKIVVFKYIRRVQWQLPINDPYCIIQPEIYFTCLSYFWTGWFQNFTIKSLAEHLRDSVPQENIKQYYKNWPHDLQKKDGVKDAVLIPAATFWIAICEALNVKNGLYCLV